MPASTPAPTPSVTEFFRGTYAPLRLVGKSRKTLESYRAALAHWAKLTDDPPIDEIDSRLLADFQAAMLGRGLAPASVNCHLRPIMAILRLAADEDSGPLLARVPKVRPIREPRRVPLALTVAEFSRVLAEARRWPKPIGGRPGPPQGAGDDPESKPETKDSVPRLRIFCG